MGEIIAARESYTAKTKARTGVLIVLGTWSGQLRDLLVAI